MNLRKLTITITQRDAETRITERIRILKKTNKRLLQER